MIRVLSGVSFAVLILSGCAPTQEEIIADARQKCSAYGYAPGSGDFSRCVETATMRAEDQQRFDSLMGDIRAQQQWQRDSEKFNRDFDRDWQRQQERADQNMNLLMNGSGSLMDSDPDF
ncbi:hypothetical protein KXR53_01225 [Inquilinus limosus]|uniref:hypothetical protein n=1 Tax=Inquilinus limosus TaxID=171674 RepID=UPI003F13A0BE